MSYYRPVGQEEPPAKLPAAPKQVAPKPPPVPKPRPTRPSRPARRIGCGGVLGAGVGFMLITLLIFGGLLAGYVGIAAALPAPEELQQRANTFASTQIYDREGNLLNEVADPSFGRRTLVTVDQISPHLKNATLATEDPNFYEHAGVDPVGIARAVYYAVRERDLSSGPGGSTITQQLVKLTFLSPERSMTRKIKEAILAAEITRRYSKDTILQIYLNEINYGNLAYGIEAASQTYFGKSAKDLTLAEASMLAGLPQAPAYYDPYTKLWAADGVTPGAVKRRQAAVLALMVKADKITTQEADAAWREPLKLRPLQQTYVMQDPHFVLYVRSHVEQIVGPELLHKGGLKIYTTLDPRIQKIATEEVRAQVAKLAGQQATNGALVAVRPATGEILALVGSADFDNAKISGQINMALAPRQPGSSIKPLTYLAAFEMPAAQIDPNATASDQISAIEPPGFWTPSTTIMDIRTEFPDGINPRYVPQNYDEKEHGPVSVRSALANSYNIPAVKALEHVGLDRLKDMAGRLGITTLTRPDYGLSLTLGGGEVTLLEMTGAYATLANGGVRAQLTPIGCVLGGDGLPIWSSSAAGSLKDCQPALRKPGAAPVVTPVPARQVVQAQYVYLITSILSDLEARRPAFGSSADLLSLPGRPSAAKTGTTNEYRDAWTMGYTPDLAVGVWIGNADYKPMQKTAGSSGAAPIWHKVMQRSLEKTEPRPFTEPQGIQRIKVCADSGTLPSEACKQQREELFAAGRGPLPAKFDLNQRVRIDRATGKPATEFTPADRIETRDLMIFPPRYRAWANAHGHPQVDIEQPAYPFDPELQLRAPEPESRVSGIVEIHGRLHLPDSLVWRLEYGVGPDPQGWGVIVGPIAGDVDGKLADWDATAAQRRHDAPDFSLRLVAYDPAFMDAPIAVSNVIHVLVEAPATRTPEPTAAPTATPRATAAPTASRTATVRPATATATARAATATSTVRAATATPTVRAATATPTPAAASLTPRPATATPTVATLASPTATATTAALQLDAAIAQPVAGARVSGVVAVTGTAGGAGFHSYELHYAPGAQPAPAAWQPVGVPQFNPSTQTGGLLGSWNTAALAAGPYTLRLTVYDGAGQMLVRQIPVQVVAGQ